VLTVEIEIPVSLARGKVLVHHLTRCPLGRVTGLKGIVTAATLMSARPWWVLVKTFSRRNAGTGLELPAYPAGTDRRHVGPTCAPQQPGAELIALLRATVAGSCLTNRGTAPTAPGAAAAAAAAGGIIGMLAAQPDLLAHRGEKSHSCPSRDVAARRRAAAAVKSPGHRSPGVLVRPQAARWITPSCEVSTLRPGGRRRGSP
jgi:hypothetical protein